jgi:hypothetical protein
LERAVSQNLYVAFELAAAGVYVFPAHAMWNEAAQKLDKRPAIFGWRKEASTDPEQIRKWWAMFPEAVPGIELGRSNLFVVDLDRHPGAPDGVTAFKTFRGSNPAPQCPTTKTPSGGYHLYFRQPDGEALGNRTGSLPKGIDVRGAGGWTVAPGAVFQQWQWRSNAAKLAAAPPVPTWIVEAIQAHKPAEQSATTASGDSGKREQAYAQAALNNAANNLAATAPGGRNKELNAAAYNLGKMIARGWIGRSTVEGRLYDAALSSGAVKDDGEKAARDTIKSGIDAGIEEPHADLIEREPKSNGAANLTITKLALLDALAYQRQRLQEAKILGIPVAALDKLVRRAQAQAADDDAELPHWKVEPWESPVETGELLTGIESIFVRFIYLPTGASVALALWVLHAWTMDAGDISPFIVLVSPTKRCGKTTVLIILQYLTPRSELASNITPSAMFRYVEEVRPTLLIDEADSFVKGNEELRGILNSGHTKAAAHVIRNVEVNGEHKPRRFSTWAPKAIATIRALADTLEDRAVVITLQRKPRTAAVERLRKRDNEEFSALRRKAARWAADNFNKLADPDPKIPDVLNDRAADNWRALLAIADLAGGDWPQRAREAARILSGDGHDAASVNVELLRDIRAAFGTDQEIRSTDLIARLAADPERPWAEWKHSRPLSQKQLAGLLRPFSIISVNVNPAGLPQGKGYRRSDFEEAWNAYCPGQNAAEAASSLPIRPSVHRPVESAQLGDFASIHEAPVDGSKSSKFFNNHAALDGWTDRKGKNGGEGDSATASTTARNGGNGHAVDGEGLPPGQAQAKVQIREIRLPAIAAGIDDDIDEIIEDRWRQ